MSLPNQTPWRIGPIPARRIDVGGRAQWIGNVEATVMVTDSVIKFWPEHQDGPCFVIESRVPRKDDSGR